MAAKVFWLMSLLGIAAQSVYAQSDGRDVPQGSGGRTTAPQPAASTAEDNDPLPPGAIARLGTTRFRPMRTAQGVSFLPNSRTLAVVTSNGYLEHWDAESGRLLREVRISKNWVYKAAHTRAGRLAALRGGYIDEAQRKSIKTISLFDLVIAEERMRMEFDDRRGEHLAISADGSTIVTDGEKISIIDAAAKAEVLSYDFARREATALGLSADGQTLAIGERDKLLIWEWATGLEPRAIPLAANARDHVRILSVEFTPDGSKLAVGADGDDGVRLIDVATGKEVRRLNWEGVRFWYPRGLTFSTDGKQIAAPLERNAGGNKGGGAAIWNAESGKPLQRLEAAHESVSHLAFSPDAKLLAGVSYLDPQMCVWNLETGERYGRDLPGHHDQPAILRFFPDEERLASAGDDGTIRLWKLGQQREVRVLKHELDASGRTRWIRGMDLSPDGKYIASSSLDDTVRVWETDTGREVYKLPGHGQLGGRRSVRFTPDSRRLVSWGDDMRVFVWDVQTGKAINEYRAQPTGVKLPAEGASPEPFGREKGVFHLEGGMVSSDASRLLVIGSDTHVFDVATGKEIGKFERTVGVNTGLAISPDNQFTIALSWGRGRGIPLQGGGAHFSAAKNHVIELRKLNDGKLIAELKLPEGGIGAAAFSQDSGQVAITIGDDNPRVLILSVPELKEIARIEGLRGRARAVEFSISSKRLAVSNADTTILVYDLTNLRDVSKPAE
ncbi:MAG: WD40 repeat domain-containing protein [Pirellulales bacterium]